MSYKNDITIVNEWEKIFSQREWGKYPGESLVRFVAQNYYKGNRADTKILEVGCGPGPNIWYLAKEGFCAYGIDNSPTAIQIAEQRLREENLEAKLAIGNIMSLPFQNNFFDAVIDCECIYCNNINDTHIILQEVQRVLKPGGRFYSRTFSTDQFIGNNYKSVAPNEFIEVNEGPLANTGFARLTDPGKALSLYGTYFNVDSIDRLDCTRGNGKIKTSELIIISEKKQ